MHQSNSRRRRALPRLGRPLTAAKIECLSARDASQRVAHRLATMWKIVDAAHDNDVVVDAAAASYLERKGELLRLLASIDRDAHELVESARNAARRCAETANFARARLAT